MDRFLKFQDAMASNAPSVLYHGSQKKIKILHPKDSGYRGRHVFATNRYSFALAYSGKQWTDYDINQSRVNGKMILTEIYPGKLEEIFNCSGYVYILSGSTFYRISGSEYASDSDVTVTDSKYIPNVLSELKRMPDVELLFFPSLPTFIKSRKSYLQNLDRLYKDRDI